MANVGRPFGSCAKKPMSAVPDSMKPYQRVTALLSFRQMAEILGISYRSFLNLRNRCPEELPKPISIGGVLRYRADDVDAWIRGKKQVG